VQSFPRKRESAPPGIGDASPPQGNLTVAEFHNMLDALAEGSQHLPNLSTESFTRASFYQGRA